VATEAQVLANRQNARQSTGPKTAEGKAVSRGNGRTHGLAGGGVALEPDEAAEVARRTIEWAAVFRPVNRVEAFHVAQYALEGVRAERCQAEERVLRQRLALRAADRESWDEDRRLEAEEIGARLARDPARVVRRLRQTPQGCDWLISRWDGLARVLAPGRPWDDAQRGLALDLLGVPATLRGGPTAADPGDGPIEFAPQAALAAGQAAELRRLRDAVLRPRDDDDRAIAMQGIDPGDAAASRALRLVRRYESACQRRMARSLQLLLGGRLIPPLATPEVADAVAATDPAPAAPPQPVEPPPALSEAAPAPLPKVVPMPAPGAPPAPSAAASSPEGPAPLKGNRRWRRAQQRLARRRAG
jgi:hypothetical protein